ncbi:YidH family protein [Corynebacterium tapiri]|uniref:DUF202 domain-containing protein n=1 Tax=Corynebacterium tapiri TaxID=1448266 RepID=A0A5C4U2I3_9CORY|nr:DUF202 domain-containing protein [Corynebacterium tapiri]TNL95361.1 DUF202 domain-containing protein [Corynebacterium tapiri]
MAHDRSRLQRTVFPQGEEPDPRFTLANERTFLAWIRTALAFLAGAVALEAVDIPSLSAHTQKLGAIAIAVVAALISLGAAVRWVRVERAMRDGRPLPVPGIVPVLVVACGIGAVVVLMGILR